MSDLVAITYADEATAEAARKKVLEMQTEYLISLEDAVVVVKDADGRIKLNQLVNPTAAGAASGSFWGFLVGLIFMMPIAGVLLGAAAGALGGKLSDYGINDSFMKGVAASINPGNAALFLLIKNMTTDKVVAGLQPFGGTVLRTNLDQSKERELRDALDAHIKANPSG